MIGKIKNKYNLFLGAIVGFLLSQLVIAEGYAIFVGAQQLNGAVGDALPSYVGTLLNWIAFIVFISTIIFFNTKKMRGVNLHKTSIYLVIALFISLFVAIQAVLILFMLTTSLWENIEYYLRTNYFVSINMFGLMWFLGVGIFIITFILLINKKIKYIMFLTKEVKGIKNEGFGRTIEVKGKDELSELCMSINEMSVELKDRIDKEKEIEKNKNEMITNISHDLKTPLTSLVGYLELLNKKDITDEAKEEYIKIAYNKSLRLKELVNELFEYTKLNNHNLKIEKVEYNISNLINQVVGESILDFLEKDIEVKLENPYRELIYQIDHKLFTRLIENLVKNAEKYSDSNSVFQVRLKELEYTIEISFINKCEEVREEQLDKIFEKFYRLDEARCSDNEGSGLGLSIAKRIVELHNGDLTVAKCGDNIEFKIVLFI
ncbi:MAG: HAMP domain-containing sensor histidine kinase [Clostridium sp.]